MTEDQERMMRLAGRYSALGIEIALSVGAGAVGGNYLDQRFGTAYLFWLGLVIGVGAATTSVLRVMRTTKLSKL